MIPRQPVIALVMCVLMLTATVGIIAHPVAAQQETSISIDTIPDSVVVTGESFDVHVSGYTGCYNRGTTVRIYEKDRFGEDEIGSRSISIDVVGSGGNFDTVIPVSVDNYDGGEMELQAEVVGECNVFASESARSDEQSKAIFEADPSDPDPEFEGEGDNFESKLNIPSHGTAYTLDSDTLEPVSEFNDDINPGDEVNLRLYVRNTGGRAGEYSTIQTQFPDFDSSNDGDHIEIETAETLGSNTFKIEPGETVNNPDGSTDDATSWQTEVSHDSWGSDAVRMFDVTATPQETGEFTIYVRSTLTDDDSQSGSDNLITEPVSGVDDPDQDYEMREITIPISPVDSDDDGIVDEEDRCPEEPEDMDGYQDDNGCPENPEPSVSLDNTQVDEGNSTTLTADATDPEGESLTYDWSLSGDGALSGSGSSVAYEAPSGVSSDTSVVASVTVSEQDEGKTAQDEATVTVQDSSSNNDPDGDGIPNSEDQCNNEPEDMDGYQDDDGCPENPAPSVSLAGAQVSEGETTTLTANANDPEGESLSYEWSLSGGGSLSESGSSATYEAPSSISSDTSATVSITVSEQDAGKSAQDSATVTVTDTGSEDEEQNQPPEVTLDVNPASAEVDQSVTFDGTGTSDSDGRITEYRWDFDGDGTIDRATSTETVTYTYAEAGSYTPELIAVDDDGARGTDTATVSVGSENVDPIANDIDVSTSEDSPVSETFFASDPDGDSLSYTIESPPSDGTVSVSGGSFTYTPESISSGTDSFVYRVNDGNGGTDTATVSITVTEPNTNDGYEPNDEFDTAASITDGNYTDLQIVDGESDYFAVTLEEGGSIDASIEFDHNTGDLDMALYEPDREALVASISTSDGESVSATDVSKGGTYYVEVRGYSDASAPYDLRVDVGSPQPSGVIIGDVVDTEANPIPGAQVRITNPSDSVIAETTTDSSGIYTVEVPPGEYTVIVESNGSTTERTVLVEPGATINADVVIQTAASESVSPSVSISNAPDRIGPNETFVIDYEIENTGTVTGPFVLDIPASTPGVTVQDIDGDIQGSDTSAEPVTAATNRVGPNETVAVSVTYDASDLSTEDITLELTARQPLDSTSDSVSSTITVTESTDPTERALQRFDGDGDGTIDRDEAVGAIVAYNIGTTIGGEEVTRTQVVRAIVAYNTGEPIET